MNDQNSRRSQTLQEIHNNGQPHLDTTSSHDDFLGQILRSVPSSASYFPWTDDQSPSLLGYLDEQSAAVLASKMKQHSITNDAAEALMLQQQMWLSRSLDVSSGLRSPTGAENADLIPVAQGGRNDVVDAPFFKSTDPANDASVKAPLNVFTGSPGQTSSPPLQRFHHPQLTMDEHLQAQNFEASAGPPMGQPAAQLRQRVRARRGQATDPHSIAERLRRARISERMKALQELVPNANKTDKASMLDDIVDYVKFLQLQVKILSVGRLGGAAAGAVARLAKDTSSERRSSNGTQTASSSQNNEGLTAAEQQVAKLMEDDMGSAIQYLHGKGLCLMPISLATAISYATHPSNNPIPNGVKASGPTSPSMSVCTVHPATIVGCTGDGEPSLEDAASVSKP